MPQLSIRLKVDQQPPSAVLVGSHEALGWWDPSKGAPLEWTGELWETRKPICLTGPMDHIDYKFVRLGEDTSAAGAKWELGPNRCLQLKGCETQEALLAATFNGSSSLTPLVAGQISRCLAEQCGKDDASASIWKRRFETATQEIEGSKMQAELQRKLWEEEAKEAEGLEAELMAELKQAEAKVEACLKDLLVWRLEEASSAAQDAKPTQAECLAPAFTFPQSPQAASRLSAPPPQAASRLSGFTPSRHSPKGTTYHRRQSDPSLQGILASSVTSQASSRASRSPSPGNGIPGTGLGLMRPSRPMGPMHPMGPMGLGRTSIDLQDMLAAKLAQASSSRASRSPSPGPDAPRIGGMGRSLATLPIMAGCHAVAKGLSPRNGAPSVPSSDSFSRNSSNADASERARERARGWEPSSQASTSESCGSHGSPRGSKSSSGLRAERKASPISTPMVDLSESPDPRIFACTRCQERFSAVAPLQIHLRLVHGVVARTMWPPLSAEGLM